MRRAAVLMFPTRATARSTSTWRLKSARDTIRRAAMRMSVATTAGMRPGVALCSDGIHCAASPSTAMVWRPVPMPTTSSLLSKAAHGLHSLTGRELVRRAITGRLPLKTPCALACPNVQVPGAGQISRIGLLGNLA